tara:strand:+ start:424 stop:570 length:147 start_codon:yes stop_codon:yes gene_type:complete
MKPYCACLALQTEKLLRWNWIADRINGAALRTFDLMIVVVFIEKRTKE